MHVLAGLLAAALVNAVRMFGCSDTAELRREQPVATTPGSSQPEFATWIPTVDPSMGRQGT